MFPAKVRVELLQTDGESLRATCQELVVGALILFLATVRLRRG